MGGGYKGFYHPAVPKAIAVDVGPNSEGDTSINGHTIFSMLTMRVCMTNDEVFQLTVFGTSSEACKDAKS